MYFKLLMAAAHSFILHTMLETTVSALMNVCLGSKYPQDLLAVMAMVNV